VGRLGRSAVICFAAVSVLAIAGPTTARPVSPQAPAKGEAGVLSSDFDGNGYEDLAVGVPLENGSYPDQGEVDVFYGGGGGLRATQPLYIRSMPGINQSFYKFGSGVAAGDVNGDGYADLAIGVPGYPLEGFGEVGTVILIPGSPQGLVPDEALYLNAKDAGHNLSNGEYFGAVLTTGDFDGDHLADIAVGAPSADVHDVQHAGGAAVFYGHRSLANVAKNGTYLHLFGAHTNDDFGASLAAGDFDGDHRDDLAVGAPLSDVLLQPGGRYTGAGNVWVYDGSSDGVKQTRVHRYFQRGTGSKPQIRAFFGAALAAGNFDGDRWDDLAVGIPFFSETHHLRAAGAVEVFYGGPVELGRGPGNTDFLEEGFHGVPSRLHREDQFGLSLAAANFGRGDREDLAVGVPGKDVEGKSNAGAVIVLYGTNDGYFNTHDNSLLSQGQGEVVGRPDPNDAFGAALAAASFRGYSRADLAVGVPGEDVVVSQGEKAKNAGAVNVFGCTHDGCKRSDHMLTQKWLHLLPEKGDAFGQHLAARGVAD